MKSSIILLAALASVSAQEAYTHLSTTTKAAKSSSAKSSKAKSTKTADAKAEKQGSSSAKAEKATSPPQDQTCPCWTLEDLDRVTEDNVVSLGLGSCNTDVPFPGFEGSLAILNSAEDFVAVGAASSKSGENECSAPNGTITELVSDEQFAICFQQIADRCVEFGYPVRPSTCPCFSEADLLAIDEANVTEDSCLINPASQTTQEVVLSNGDVTYTYTYTYTGAPGQCSSPTQEEDILTVPEDATCQQLIFSRCRDIGKL